MPNYNLISQKFTGSYNEIPFLREVRKNDRKYNVSVDIMDTDYIETFFQTSDLSDVYAIYILNSDEAVLNLNFIYKNVFNGRTICIVKAEPSFFTSIRHNSRIEIERPLFFRSVGYENLNVEEILKDCLYQREIAVGNLKKAILRVDALKLLENEMISTVIRYHINLEEHYLEKVLQLKENVLDVHSDYIAKVEISL
ncbi:hypothetical protein [Flavobacterium branchiicola]|uniref:Uncharacterized protein n=1 Tax=Flavobacterium branchiicola TaxID=1114875 RepID=A0ABV9PJS3_9FLAO|nr:hypothetical protein [Flavobacterium branchiicola]MBS7256764.1 hypothetical protein [Flavobacterium branchiicola]